MLQKIISYCHLTRFNKPIGWLILLWPTLTALWLASGGQPNLNLILIFTADVIITRSLGCVINDLADRKFDAHVQRTQNRPLVTQAVSIREALILAFILAFLAFGLVLFTNLLTIKLSFVALGLACLYPFMKRVTFYPQVFLGAAFGFGVPMAYAAALNSIPFIAWLLFLAILIWALAYDTVYAMVDKEDDLKIGIKSTAIVFGSWDKFWVGLSHITVIVLLAIIGWLYHLNDAFYLSLGVCFGLAIYQQYLIQDRKPQRCFEAFLNNHWFGFSFFVGTILGYY